MQHANRNISTFSALSGQLVFSLWFLCKMKFCFSSVYPSHNFSLLWGIFFDDPSHFVSRGVPQYTHLDHQRVLCWALSLTSHSISPVSFQSDHHFAVLAGKNAQISKSNSNIPMYTICLFCLFVCLFTYLSIYLFIYFSFTLQTEVLKILCVKVSCILVQTSHCPNKVLRWVSHTVPNT